MSEAATATWLLTMLGGLYLFLKVARPGASPEQVRHTNLPPLATFAHPVLAVAGFVLWLVYLNGDVEEMAWVSFGALALIAGSGLHLFLKTLARNRTAVVAGTPGEGVTAVGYAEHDLPKAAVLAHGALALVTTVLVFLTALTD